jgi:hypothetical protein
MHAPLVDAFSEKEDLSEFRETEYWEACKTSRRAWSFAIVMGERIFFPCKASVQCGLNVKRARGAHAGRQVTSIYDKGDSIDVGCTVRYQKRDCMSDFIRGS